MSCVQDCITSGIRISPCSASHSAPGRARSCFLHVWAALHACHPVRGEAAVLCLACYPFCLHIMAHVSTKIQWSALPSVCVSSNQVQSFYPSHSLAADIAYSHTASNPDLHMMCAGRPAAVATATATATAQGATGALDVTPRVGRPKGRAPAPRGSFNRPSPGRRASSRYGTFLHLSALLSAPLLFPQHVALTCRPIAELTSCRQDMALYLEACLQIVFGLNQSLCST